MKKIVILIIVITMTLLMLCGCSNINWRNEAGKYSSGLPLQFTNTGISVKNEQDRIYNIVKDKNGWLYYCSDIEGNLILVLDVDGNPTKNIETITE